MADKKSNAGKTDKNKKEKSTPAQSEENDLISTGPLLTEN